MPHHPTRAPASVCFLCAVSLSLPALAQLSVPRVPANAPPVAGDRMPVATPPPEVNYPRSVTTPGVGSDMPVVRPSIAPTRAPRGPAVPGAPSVPGAPADPAMRPTRAPDSAPVAPGSPTAATGAPSTSPTGAPLGAPR